MECDCVLVINLLREAKLAEVEVLLLHRALHAELAQIEVGQLRLRIARDAQGGRSLAATAFVGQQH